MKRTIFLIISIIIIVMAITGCTTADENEAINNATNLIAAIGDVNIDSGPAIEAADHAYSDLDTKLQKKVENFQFLADAKESYNTLIANEVMQLISDIGSVTQESKSSIDLAYEAYNSLNDEQKTLVNNYDDLQKAKKSYDQLKADEVIASINSLNRMLNPSKESIDSAFEKYNLLTEEQKALVVNYDLLENAKQEFNELVANRVVEKIKSIGIVTLESKSNITNAQTAYDSLTPEQQKLVTNYDDIQSSRDELFNLEVANVIDLIDAIGEVDINSSSAISTANQAYAALTPAQQELVPNYTKLEKSTKDLSILEVNNVISMIDEIGTVKLANKPQVVEARTAYEKLSTNQQKEVTNYDILESSETAIIVLEVAEVNRLLTYLNLNYLQATDETKVLEIKSIYDKLPADAKSEVKNPEKIPQALKIFMDYKSAKEKAAKGDYEGAYYLMVDLNYLDSKTLARQYEKIAFRWWVEGGPIKTTFGRSEKFEFLAVVYGGKPGESIDISITCRTPDWTASDIFRDLFDGWGWHEDNLLGYYNVTPQYASQGRGKLTIRNYSTGEILAEWEFEIFGD